MQLKIVNHIGTAASRLQSDLSADFLNFGANNFPFKIPFKKCFKIVFLSLWRRDPVVELQFPTPLHVVLLCFATHFAAEDRKSYWNGASRLRSDLSADFFNFGASNFPFKIPFKKCFKIVFLSLWRRDPVVELQFPTPLHVVLLCFAPHFAAEDRKSYWNGCIKAAK